jgi:lipoprotein-releasing system permease protein
LTDAPSSIAPPFSAWERSIAARYLRAKRKEGGVALISGIAFVGIMLAVAVLIIVMSVMNGFRTDLLARILGFNGHIYVAGPAIGADNRDQLIAQLKKIPGVVQVNPVIEAQSMVISRTQVTGGIVRGMRPADVKATSIVSKNITAGAMDGFGKGDFGGENILVGSRLAENLGVRPGDTLSIVSPSGASTAFGSTPRRKAYTVGGTFTVGMSDYDSAFIYMPLQQAQAFFGRDDDVDMIEINLANADDLDTIRPLVTKAAGPAAVVTDWRDKNHSFFNALQVERNTMRLILMMLVAIAAMNIISGLIMLVKNKSRDIAILRTMGASQGAILRIFFMSGAWIGGLGTLAGIAIGTLFCVFIDPIQTAVEFVTGVSVFSPDTYFLSRIPARVEWSEVAIITVFSLAASFLATLGPAWQASRIDPVEALRYE